MNFPLFIARRYFLAKRKKNFINLISLLSMAGIAFSTAALVIVLSVFNGLEGLLARLYNSFDPEIKIEAVKGKSFVVSDSLRKKIAAVRNVKIVTDVIEDYAYIRYRESDMPVTMKGVSDNFLNQHRLDGHIVEGTMKLHDDNAAYAIIGRGIQYQLSVSIKESLTPIQVLYIKNSRSTSIDPAQLYVSRSLMPGAVFSIEKNYDENFIILPLDFVRELMDYGDRRTSLEIKTASQANLNQVKADIQRAIGQKFQVLTNQEQHQDLFRLVKMEKLFTFLALTVLILVASINIFFSLMMLAIDKKKDISILSAVGAPGRLIQQIFLTEGALIAFSGAGVGLLLGGLICWAQDRFGLVGMGMENAIVSAYPVTMRPMDFVYVSGVIVLITFLISFYPARLAARSFSTEQL